MGMIDKLKFVARMMADPEVDRLYRELKGGGIEAAPAHALWWREKAAFLRAHSLEAAIEKGMKVGANPRVEPCVIFMGHDLIEIGDDFVASFGANIRAVSEPIRIGNGVSLGPYAAIIGANHGIAEGRPHQQQEQSSRPVTIGDDVWVAAGAVVLPGVAIGRGAVVGAGAVVREDVPESAIVAGNPASVVGKRD